MTVSITPLDERVFPIEIVGTPPPIAPEAERVWAEMARANPRLYAGPILAVEAFDSAAPRLRCRRDTYRNLAVQPRVPTGTELLALTLVLLARDRAGRERVLFGRRAEGVHLYAGMWELGPSGGIPPPDGPTLTREHVHEHARRELAEEAGIADDGLSLDLVAAARDPGAFSLDLVLLARTSRPVEDLGASTGWEYSETAWVPLASVASFIADFSREVIPPTRRLVHHFRWA